MNGKQGGRRVLATLVLGLSLGGATLAGWMELDPGVSDVGTSRPSVTTDVMVEPGAWARLDMALGEYRIEVMSGEVSVVFTDDRRTVLAGYIRVIPAGTAFGLLNTGAEPARIRISVLTLPVQRLPPLPPTLAHLRISGTALHQAGR